MDLDHAAGNAAGNRDRGLVGLHFNDVLTRGDHVTDRDEDLKHIARFDAITKRRECDGRRHGMLFK